MKPDVVALGYDEERIEQILRKVLDEKKLSIEVLRVSQFTERDLVSSSKIKRKIIENYRANAK